MPLLAVTFTIQPKHYKECLARQYELVKEELRVTPFAISVVAEITKSGNLHLHGIVEAKEPKRGTLKQHIIDHFRKAKVVGFIYVKEITDLEKWIGYCLKDFEKTKKDLDFAPIVMLDQAISFPEGLDLLNIIVRAPNIPYTDIDNLSY